MILAFGSNDDDLLSVSGNTRAVASRKYLIIVLLDHKTHFQSGISNETEIFGHAAIF